MMQAALERDIGSAPGAVFFKRDDVVMFAFRLDASSIIGPRAATQKDQAEHYEAWEDFRRREALGPLDRDASGADGGSLAKEFGPAMAVKPQQVAKTPEPVVVPDKALADIEDTHVNPMPKRGPGRPRKA